MITWMITHYKAVIAYATALITLITIPVWIAAAGFIMRTEASNAAVPKHEERILELEKAISRNDERSVRMEQILIRIEEREYQELKQARQFRQASKP